MTHTADNTDRQEPTAMTNLFGVWKSTDKREPNRHIYVTEVRGAYAYGYQCSANGMRLPKAKTTRVLVAYHGRSLARYRRPERSSVGGTTTSGEEQTHG